MWSNFRDWIRPITINSEYYHEKYLNIKFDSDDKVTLNKAVEIPSIIIVVRAAFHENKKYYLQVFLD